MSTAVASHKKRQDDAKKKQSGELPPDLDEKGKMINPHNPDFITKVPWYLGESGPTLKHHNVQKLDHFLSLSESDQLLAAKEAKKNEATRSFVFRKGACKNCGAMTHKEKDCVERPRSMKKSAWKSGIDIAPDEVVLKLEEHGKVAYDAKRDQWQGYNPEEYKSTIERFNRIDDERRRHKQQQKELQRREEEEMAKKSKQDKEQKKLLAKKARELGNVISGEIGEDGADGANNGGTTKEEKDSSEDSDSDSDYDSDEDNNNEEEDDARDFMERDEKATDFQGRSARQGGIGGAQMKVTVRNLRIREDTPKYLRNLDLNSAHYDPKARSMRMNPLPDENPEDLAYAGDNFMRATGDALKLAQSQVLCWEMQARGEDIDIMSNPSQAELVQKNFLEKKKDLEAVKKNSILEKYGVANQGDMDYRLKLGQTEVFVEYTPDGRVMKGPGSQKISPITKYEQSVVLVNNHLSVWGSYYCNKSGRKGWGYACCHSLIKNSYCTGKSGQEANDAASQAYGMDSHMSRKMLDLPNKAASTTQTITKRSDIYGEASADATANLNEEKVKESVKRLKEEERRRREAGGDVQQDDDRKRGYNSMHTDDVNLEDMEAYRRVKLQRNDPLAAFAGITDADGLLQYK